jgi:GT2 family glycosyltransferase
MCGMKLSAYIPCCNNAAHIAAAVQSLQRQDLPIDDITVVDDGSTDGSPEVAEQAGARVLRHLRNLGRGPVNAWGVESARHDLVVILGATNVLPPGFTARAVRWFDESRVAAVCARVVPPPPVTLADRWRARHLFLAEEPAHFARGYHFASTGSMLRRSAALAVGNFDRRLTHTEDGELGWRLTAAGYDILFDPELHVIPRWSNPLGKVLERHWRWYAGVEEKVTLKSYLKSVGYSIKVMVRRDLEKDDWASASVSLLVPHHHLIKTVARRLGGKSAQWRQ